MDHRRWWSRVCVGIGLLALCSLAHADDAGAERMQHIARAVTPLVEDAASHGIRVSVGLAALSAAGDDTVIVGSQDSYNPASTIKLALLATVMRQVDRGLLQLDAPITISPYMVVGGAGKLQDETMPYTTTVGELARRMVVHSDNTATNVLFYLVGIPTVQALLDDLGLRTMRFNRQMFPGDKITQPANVIDAADAVALLRAMYRGPLLGEESRNQALTWLRAQEVDTKFGAVLDNRLIAHKTGETGQVTHDAGYLLVPGREIVLVVMTEVTASEGYEDTMRIGNPVVQRIATAAFEALTEP